MKKPETKLSWIGRGYFWLAERLYHELAWLYDPVSWLVSLGHWDEARKCALDYLGDGRVLELGFGTGELLLEMRRRGLEVVGLDASPEMQRVTRRKIRRSGLWAPRLQASVQHMPFANGSFDSLVATFPAGYILELETWLEAARVLRPAPSAERRDDPVVETAPPSTSAVVLTEGKPGRLIVVGVVALSGRKRLEEGDRLVSGRKWEQVLGQFEKLAQASGLCLEAEYRRIGGAILPILIAERIR